MPLYYSIPIFAASLAFVVGGSELLARVMARLGERWSIPEQFLGFLTALGADSPEISSAVTAMLSGQTATGVGVVFGSNLFNLAALLGLTAVMAGSIRVRREPALLEGGVAILVVSVAAGLTLGAISSPVALGLVLLLMVPYVVLLALSRDSLQKLPLPEPWRAFVVSAASEAQEHGKEVQRTDAEDQVRRDRRNPKPPKNKEKISKKDKSGHGKLLFYALGSLAIIVSGSVGLVRSATWLTAGWLPSSLLGTLVLAGLTGIPNLYTAVRLARRHRGAAVFTEAMNSNSLNIVVGLTIPALIFGSISPHSKGGYLDIVWLWLLTLGVVIMLAASKGLSRKQGAAIIAAYLLFVAIRVYLSF